MKTINLSKVKNDAFIDELNKLAFAMPQFAKQLGKFIPKKAPVTAAKGVMVPKMTMAAASAKRIPTHHSREWMDQVTAEARKGMAFGNA